MPPLLVYIEGCDKVDAIRTCNMTKKYQLKSEQVIAVNNLIYNFEYGKIYAIMGHSGSGKSTLIQCLGILDKATSGKIYINQKDIYRMTKREHDKIRNNIIGFVFQNYYLNNNLRAYENVMLPMLINEKYKNIDIKKRAIDLLVKVGLKERINHYPKQMSGGEQQRVAIARALANDPSIILADEPTGNLDEENEKFILEILKEKANEGKCVIIVSHNPIVKNYADVVINMSRGTFKENTNEV